jgi:hypothetical protein
MCSGLHLYFEKGVIYHAFSDHSGMTIYSTFSNEVFVATVGPQSLINAFEANENVDENAEQVRKALVKKGFIKAEWH